MENIIETCKSLDYSWLPPEIGKFKLKVTGPDEIVKAQKILAAGEAVLTLPLFHYENDLGWKWCALYDKEVEDYTVHVVIFCAPRVRTVLAGPTRTLCSGAFKITNQQCRKFYLYLYAQGATKLGL